MIHLDQQLQSSRPADKPFVYLQRHDRYSDNMLRGALKPGAHHCHGRRQHLVAAAELAEEAGLIVVMNRCPKIEYARLSGELGWCGINSRVITAKSLRPPKA